MFGHTRTMTFMEFLSNQVFHNLEKSLETAETEEEAEYWEQQIHRLEMEQFIEQRREAEEY